MKTGNDMFLEIGNDTNLKTGNDLFIDVSTNANLTAGAILNIQTGDTTNLTVGGQIKISSGDIIDILGGGNINLDATDEIHLNDGIATAGGNADPASTAKEAYWTNRVPDHEPWGRIMYIETDNDEGNTHTPELDYNDPNVGKQELGETIERGTFWHR